MEKVHKADVAVISREDLISRPCKSVLLKLLVKSSNRIKIEQSRLADHTKFGE